MKKDTKTKTVKPRSAKYEKPLKLDMAFDEAIKRISRVPPPQKRKKATGHEKPAHPIP